MRRDWTLTIGNKRFPENYCLSYSLKYFAKPITTETKFIAKRLSERGDPLFTPASCRLERVPEPICGRVHACAFVGFLLFSLEVALPCTESEILPTEVFFLPFVSVRLKFSFLKWKMVF